MWLWAKDFVWDDDKNDNNLINSEHVIFIRKINNYCLRFELVDNTTISWSYNSEEDRDKVFCLVRKRLER